MLLPLLLLSLTGCDQVTALLGTEPPPPAAPAAPPPKDLAAQTGDVRKLLLAGKADKALEGAERLLAAHPEDDGLWDLVELAAIRAGAAGALVDRLSADQAIGNRPERHHLLRGVLAVEANRLGDALNAAKALETTAPGDAAAVVALAVARGAPVPEGLGSGAAALVAARDPAVAIDPAAEALPGWRAALVRAEARLARGDRAGAALEAATADAGGARARALAAIIRVRAASSGSEAWSAADPAARAALGAGDGVGAAEVLDAVLPAALGSWKARPLADLAGELRGKLSEAGNTDGAARVAVIEAEAALRAGLPLRAREAAKLAAELPATKVRASWTLALAGAAVGSPADVEAAAASLAEPRAGAARDLVKALRGQSPTLPTPGLEGPDAALQALLGAGWLADGKAAYAAAAAAAGTAAPDLASWASLAGTRAPPALPADAAPASGLRAERDVRAWLASGATAAFPADLDHPNLAGWSALLGGSPAAADAPGVAAWARARAALSAGDSAAAAREVGALATVVPAWRSGPWAPLLALDGPLPGDLDGDAAGNRRSADPVPFTVAHHGWAARVASSEQLWRHGIAPFPAGATAEQRAAVWDAVATLRAGTLAWAAGAEPWPAAAVTALDEAEKAAGLGRFPPPSLASLRSTLDGDALLSFRPTGNGIEALYVGEDKARVAMLPDSLTRDTAALLADLRLGQSPVAAGDRVRSVVIDPAMDVLIGVGRYIVVGPTPLGLLPVAALPEQADGLRFLASIRHVGYLPDLDAILPATRPEFEPTVTMLALCADPIEASVIRRIYPDATILEGQAATVASFREKAAKSRFLHIGGFPASADGGFLLADGALSLGEIAGTPIGANGVVIQGGQEPEVIAGRIAALRRAGANDVLVEGWAGDPALRESLLLHFWEGINRRYSASRSLSEARTLAIREVGDPARLPGSWAGYFVAGRP